ncbi:MAG: hypothetical protein ACE5KZ_10975 [Candidatus Scalinduaceae bacterium]
MSAVLEQYFQSIVVDKINEIISKQFQEIRDDLEARYNEIQSDISGLKKIESNYTDLRIEIASLKKRVADSGQEMYGRMHEDIEGCETRLIGTIKKDIQAFLTKNGKKAATTKKASAKKTVAKKPTAKKPAAKKKTAKK